MAKQEIDKTKTNIITPTFRVSYPHLFKPNAYKPGDKLKYSVTMLFPKSADLSVMKLAIKHAKLTKWPDKNDWPEELESPVTDGDDPKFAEREGYANHWVIRASTNEEYKPTVLDRDGEEILKAGDFYPGCYARAAVYAYVWEYMKKQGVGFILDHVQKVKDGKSFGGKKPASQVFGPLSADDGDDDDTDDEQDFR